MKRRIFKLTIFLILGAIINVAVSWGCAYSTRDFKAGTAKSTGMLIKSNRWWEVNCWTCFRSTFVSWTVITFADEDTKGDLTPMQTLPWWSSLPSSVEEMTSIDLGSDRVHGHLIMNRFQAAWGLPLRTFGLEYEQRGNANPEVINGWPLNVKNQSYFPRAIPNRAIWPGFAINTIFYAAIVWALFAVPGYIKRRRRIKRGLCVNCAYPVGVTSAVCSECGTPVHPRNAPHGAAAPCNPC